MFPRISITDPSGTPFPLVDPTVTALEIVYLHCQQAPRHQGPDTQTPSSLELYRTRTRHNETAWNETIAEVCLCFAPDEMRTAPFSSSFFHSVSLAAQIEDFACTFEPFSFPFFGSSLQQLLCCHFLQPSHLGSPFRKTFIVMLHKLAPQNLVAIVWQRRRQRQTLFTSFISALFL